MADAKKKKAIYIFFFLQSWAVFPLIESYKVTLFKLQLLIGLPGEEVLRVPTELRYCQALLIYGKNSQLETYESTF